MNFLADDITISADRIEAAGFTIEGLTELQTAARRAMLRALRWNTDMPRANWAIEKSERLHAEADRAFDAYNDAIKKVLK